MLDKETVKQWALSLPETTIEPHFEKISFRVAKKIFATLDKDKQLICLKLSRNDQNVFSLLLPGVMFPVPNKWGKQGWTFADLNKIPSDFLVDALKCAYCEVAPQKLADQVDLEPRAK